MAYDKSIRVPKEIIDEFRKIGMSAALKKYHAGEGDAAFNEGIQRYYPSAAPRQPKVTTASAETAPGTVTTTNKFTHTTEDTPGYRKGMTPEEDRQNVNRLKGKAKTDARLAGLQHLMDSKGASPARRMAAARKSQAIMDSRKKQEEQRKKKPAGKTVLPNTSLTR